MKLQSIILFIAGLTLFNSTNCFSQTTINKSPTQSFHLYYGFSGLGSNMGSFQPIIKIDGTSFLYTYEQNSYYGTKDTRIDTVCIKTIRQSSIDSIVDIIKDLKDTSIREYNFCIMSGGIHSLVIINGNDTTSFLLSNTFHYSALKVANILNEYAPANKKIWADEKMIKDAEECLTGKLTRWTKVSKKKTVRPKKKNGT